MLRLQSISKSFAAVKALDDVSIGFNTGQVHALCGENGAGKSTLMHIIAGYLQPDSGQIYWNDELITISNVQHAQQLGIGIVYQERTLAGSLTVAENIFPLNPARTSLRLINYKALYGKTRQLLDELGLGSISPKTIVDTLSPARKQMVEIARALAQQPSLLVLDEPTASLTALETDILFAVIRRMVKNGTGVIYISHRMAEIAGIADVVSVLKDGRYQGSFDAKQTPPELIISKMVGRVLQESKYVTHVKNIAALELRHLGGYGFSDISFTLHRGEILGIAGLEGSGRTSLARAIFGDKRINSGKILKAGSVIHPRHPADAIATGIAYLPEDRKVLGLFSNQDIASNIAAAGLRGFWYDAPENRRVGNAFTKMLNIKIRSLAQPVQELSGGNQQKCILAKWLHINPDVLIINEPTHGVDVGAKAGIYEELKKITASGKSVLLISSDLPELLLLSDRIMVMYNGQSRSILERGDMSEERVAALASGI